MLDKQFEMYIDRAKKFFERLGNDLFIDTRVLKAEYAHSKDPVPYKDRLNGTFKEITEGEHWGDSWDSAWFHLTGEIPAEWAGKHVALNLNFAGEGLIFDENGVPVYSLTDGSIFHENYSKEVYQLTDCAKGGEKLDFWVETAANNLFGLKLQEDPALNCPHPYGEYEGVAKTLRVGLFNYEGWQLRLDLEVLLGMVEALPDDDYRSARIVAAMNEAVNVYAKKPENSAAARVPLKKILELPAMASAMEATAVGHAHIDTGWLWPVRETIRKCARTFASQIHLIEKYPGYVFGASAPQHYAFTKEHYPELYEKIKKCVKDGTWELQGGMWVEADCNVISGESMVRQFLHGKNFYMDEFGVDVKNLWIPDVFGYSAAMPQIIKKSKCDYFLTQKISWSQFNKFPYHTFMWRGIDGTEVLTHFPPEDTYNAALDPKEAIPAQNKLNENSFMGEYMSLFGIGDGGGGPKEEYIERGMRMQNLEGCPKVKFGRADNFFDKVSKYTDDLPKWVGELYLELHRGTLTTQSRTKRGNRKLEQALALAEFLCACLPFNEYPQEELDKAWKILLINQFHDIIPGSSITMVYQQTEKEHAEALASCESMIMTAAEKLFERDANSAVLFNSLSYDYTAPVALPSDWAGFAIADAEGNEVATQMEQGSLYVLTTIPAGGFVTLKKGASKPAEEAKALDSLVLENDLIRYEFDTNAQLVSAFDKTVGREVLKSGENGNMLSLYIDHPNNWEAWDVDFFYEHEFVENAVSTETVKGFAGKVRKQLTYKLKIGDSSLTQVITLAPNSKRLDFNTAVKWTEARKMLRVSFPTSMFATEASFDIQYGYAKRPTHRNTSWDRAKFEVAAQRYIDISEQGYGVALLNDCKYGHKVLDSTLDLCLLRSPKYPDWDADQGDQVFAYSLLPHENALADSDVFQEAACLNRAPMVFGGFASTITAPCTIDSEDVTLEVLKKAEKEDCHVIRLLETKGRVSKAVINVNKGSKLIATDMMEWDNGAELAASGGKVEVTLKPFEISTYKLV